jgi:hypothetical protein
MEYYVLTFGAGFETGPAVSVTCDYLSESTNQFVVSNPEPDSHLLVSYFVISGSAWITLSQADLTALEKSVEPSCATALSEESDISLLVPKASCS